ncbi:MAG: alpha/beta hydrolase [Spongiibacteraceae bacterium]
MNNDNLPLDLALMDPELRELLIPIKAQLQAIGIDGFNTESIALMRQLMNMRGEDLPQGEPRVEKRFIAGIDGAPDVAVYVIGAQAGAAKPAILHMHGGGYVIGNAVSALPRFQQLARDNNCVIVSVEYRLAPETPFPGALDDNYSALKWLHDNAETLGVDRARISVMGESAGGGHAAMLAIAARDRGEVSIHHQILIYPMLDDRTGNLKPNKPWVGQHIWTASDNYFGWSALLGVAAGSPSVPAGSVPARVENLSGLPTTFIAVGSLDLFVNESIEYARRLLDAGVPTDLCVMAGAFHGFDGLAPTAAISQRFTAAVDAAVRRACV